MRGLPVLDWNIAQIEGAILEAWLLQSSRVSESWRGSAMRALVLGDGF